ncbi:sugar transferase [Pseudoroseomonas globiformis]|uniref:Sugar transferase n=1 Tax=Teichococcus globiformis TaxID=2307229 RepID=A0ABV7G0S5_9PROT
MADWYARWGKRVLDVAGAGLGLLLLSPLLGGTALAVLLCLGRPILFRQERAGHGGVPFTLLKFRSMRDGPGDDAERLTPFGRRLRASALDELPQLLNVLWGEMSLVGPRPLPMAYNARYTQRQARRLMARPGLAGVAQAAGRNALPWTERLEMDARYAEAIRLRTDLHAIAGTALILLSGRGVSAPGHATMPRFDPAMDTASKESSRIL